VTFSQAFEPAAIRRAVERARYRSEHDVAAALTASSSSIDWFATLLSPAAGSMLEALAQRAHALTVERFGKTMNLYAPLYLSNDCVCTCSYCGFSRELPIKRKTLSVEEVKGEAQVLASHGLRSVLLVSSEHPKFINPSYIAQCVSQTKSLIPYVAIEVAAARTPEYALWVEAGCDGVVLYQETYDPDLYPVYHLGGPKKHYAFRLDAPGAAAEAGVRHLGLGALLGLSDWRFEVLSLFAHAWHLYRHCSQAHVNISFPRINPAAGGFVPPHAVSDADLVHIITATRIGLPAAGIVLSTREPAALRDRLIPLGITHMSAGSSTEPGGYEHPGEAGEQFHLEDTRSPEMVSRRLIELGYDPVFKDWERGLSGAPNGRPPGGPAPGGRVLQEVREP
jgi:2-iminoacetate synthase